LTGANNRLWSQVANIEGAALLDTLMNDTTIIHRDIHLVHHSHTDIGYSHLQAEVETIQNNNIWKALELIDRTKDYPEDSRFVWNVESLWAVENFLGIASERTSSVSSRR
jgi:alpha-mannosidase